MKTTYLYLFITENYCKAFITWN